MREQRLDGNKTRPETFEERLWSMINVKMLIFQAMVDTKRLLNTERIEIVDVFLEGRYARVGITAFHARKKKPYKYWNVCVDTVRKEVVWDTTTSYTI